MLSRLYRKAEALDQACLRARGHPHDYAIRQELLSALEWEAALNPDHADPLIRQRFEEVRKQSAGLSSVMLKDAAVGAAVPAGDLDTLRQQLARLLRILAARKSPPHE